VQNKRFNWVNAIVLTATPILAVVLASWYVAAQGFVWTDLVPFVAMYFLSGLAVTAGYHRYYAHRTYDCHPVVQALLLLFATSALQNSALAWVSDHRSHHRHVDGDGDPYNINRGFLWAHIGWIFFEDLSETRDRSNVPDLERSRLVRLQARFYVALAVLVGLGVPFLIGLAFGRPWGGMLWGGLVRTVFVHHCTFLINSAAHFFGKAALLDGDLGARQRLARAPLLRRGLSQLPSHVPERLPQRDRLVSLGSDEVDDPEPVVRPPRLGAATNTGGGDREAPAGAPD
jgi:stearoyl-CoA desaturase (delta-9 desaturase)